jgi:hypothetical protein
MQNIEAHMQHGSLRLEAFRQEANVIHPTPKGGGF